MNNQLLIDSGNSCLKIAILSEKTGLRLIDRLPRGELQRLGPMLGTLPPITHIWWSCGQPTDEVPIRAGLLAAAPGVVPVLLSRETAPGLMVHYSSGTPGPDRLAAALALRRRFPGRRALSVDCGTATNLTLVNEAGEFMGGAILPGLTLSLSMLQGATAGRLPLVELGGPAPEMPGQSTVESIRAGVILGHAGAIDRLVAESAAQAVVLTGGAAEWMRPYLKTMVGHRPDLVLEGLAIWGKSLL